MVVEFRATSEWIVNQRQTLKKDCLQYKPVRLTLHADIYMQLSVPEVSIDTQ